MTRPKSATRLTVGERIAHARDTYRLSQAQLGANLGVTRAAVSQYEQDKIKPRERVIKKLAELFNTDPRWFAEGHGKAPNAHDAPVCIPEINVAGLTGQITDLRELSIGRELQLPAAMFELGLAVGRHEMVAILAPNDAGAVLAGDTVVVDTQRRHPAPDGVYLVHTSNGPQLRCGAHGALVIIGRAVAYLHTL